MTKEIKLLEGEELEQLRARIAKKQKAPSKALQIQKLEQENQELKYKVYELRFLLEKMFESVGNSYNDYKN